MNTQGIKDFKHGHVAVLKGNNFISLTVIVFDFWNVIIIITVSFLCVSNNLFKRGRRKMMCRVRDPIILF